MVFIFFAWWWWLCSSLFFPLALYLIIKQALLEWLFSNHTKCILNIQKKRHTTTIILPLLVCRDSVLFLRLQSSDDMSTNILLWSRIDYHFWVHESKVIWTFLINCKKHWRKMEIVKRSNNVERKCDKNHFPLKSRRFGKEIF